MYTKKKQNIFLNLYAFSNTSNGQNYIDQKSHCPKNLFFFELDVNEFVII